MRLLDAFRYPLDLDAVARKLVSILLDDWTAQELLSAHGQQMLRTEYMRIVAVYGLPVAALETVRRRALRLLAAAANEPIPAEQGFSFYD